MKRRRKKKSLNAVIRTQKHLDSLLAKKGLTMFEIYKSGNVQDYPDICRALDKHHRAVRQSWKLS